MMVTLSVGQIDDRTQLLVTEFETHFADAEKALRAGGMLKKEDELNEISVFQGWVIQKIAGLQLLLEQNMPAKDMCDAGK